MHEISATGALVRIVGDIQRYEKENEEEDRLKKQKEKLTADLFIQAQSVCLQLGVPPGFGSAPVKTVLAPFKSKEEVSLKIWNLSYRFPYFKIEAILNNGNKYDLFRIDSNSVKNWKGDDTDLVEIQDALSIIKEMISNLPIRNSHNNGFPEV